MTNAKLSIALSQEAIAQTLNNMPSEWLNELHQSAMRLKGKQVILLLEELPSNHSGVAKYLVSLAENYGYEKIIELTQVLLQE